MKCNHCGSEWTTAVENQKATCPFCGKQLESANSSHPVARGRFQLSYDKTTLVQFLGDEKNVVIPAGITRIGAGAFHGYGVETVYIPDGVTEIGDNCFNGCKQLREVRIPASVTHISDSAFKDTGKKKIIAERGSYAWNKYAKPVEEDKPVTPISQAEPKPINKAVSASASKPIESTEKAGTPTSKVPVTEQPAGNTPSAKELYEQQIDEFLALQHKKAQWAQLLGCESGERPWIIKSSLAFIENRRVAKLVARIKNIHDQELLARIEEETNDGRVRLAAVENITDQNRLFSIIHDTQNSNIRRTAVERITDQGILKQLANNKDDTVRIAVARKINDQKTLEQMALNDSNEYVRSTARARITDKKVLQQITQNEIDTAMRSNNYRATYAKDTSKVTTDKSNSVPNTKCKHSDSDILKKVENALRLVNQLKDEDEGNFINLTIQGLSNNMVVSFGAATELLIKVQYCGSSVTWAWQQASYVPYDKYKELFVLTTEQSGDYFFIANVKLEGASAVTTLNAALQNTGFAKKVNSGSKSLYCSLL